MWRGQCAGAVTGLCLGTVQLLVFACYASSFWLGAYLVQEELIQAGQFVAVSGWLIPLIRLGVVPMTTGILCSTAGGCVCWTSSASFTETGCCRNSC